MGTEPTAVGTAVGTSGARDSVGTRAGTSSRLVAEPGSSSSAQYDGGASTEASTRGVASIRRQGETSSEDVQCRRSVRSGRSAVSCDQVRSTNEEASLQGRTNEELSVSTDIISCNLSKAEDRLLSTKERTTGKRVRRKPDWLKVTLGSGQSYV